MSFEKFDPMGNVEKAQSIDGLGDGPEDIPDQVKETDATDEPVHFDIDAVYDRFKTDEGEAFFWSGNTSFGKPDDMSDAEYRKFQALFGGADRAADIAAARGGTTLEMRMEAIRDELIANHFPFDEASGEFIYDPSDEENARAWESVSQSFAEQACGDIHVVYGGDENTLYGDPDDESSITSYDSIYSRTEYDTLLGNDGIASIAAIDPITEQERVVYRKEGDEAGE